MLSDGLELCGLLWCFYQLFGQSFWRHPFTEEDPSVSKWWNAQNLFPWRNKLLYILADANISVLDRCWSVHGLAFVLCREAGPRVLMDTIRSVPSIKRPRKWPSLPQNWPNKSSSMQDSWKWLCSADIAAHVCIKVHVCSLKYTNRTIGHISDTTANTDSQRTRPELFSLQVINIYLYQGLSVWLSAGRVNLMNIQWLGLTLLFFSK